MTRLLFLDIDGVIAGNGEWGIMMDDHSCPFNRGALDALEFIIESLPDTQIIISSTWRKGTSIEELQRIFKYRNFKYWQKVGDKTKVLFFEEEAGKEIGGYLWVPRGCEIAEYIGAHIKFIGQYRYVILDDGSDMMYWQKDNFVHTRDHLLTLEDAGKAIQILK